MYNLSYKIIQHERGYLQAKHLVWLLIQQSFFSQLAFAKDLQVQEGCQMKKVGNIIESNFTEGEWNKSQTNEMHYQLLT